MVSDSRSPDQDENEVQHDADQHVEQAPNADEQKPSVSPQQESPSETPEEKAQRLRETVAALSDDEYELRRKDLAREYGVRVAYLDELRPSRGNSLAGGFDFSEPELWPEEVDGAKLLNELVAIQRRYTVLPEGGAEAGALWILFAWSHDLADHSPILALVSPDKRCGKSSYLSLLSRLAPRVFAGSNATAAGVYRAIEANHATIVLDEMDTYIKSNELRGILNSGHARTQAYVVRADGQYSTWAPKVFALIGSLPSTLMDRSITVRMKRRMASEKVQRLNLRSIEEYATELRSRAFTWVEQNKERLEKAEPEVPPMNDRAADNWYELIKVADVAGGRWPTLARRIARKFADRDADDESMMVALLHDIKSVFEERGVTRIGSTELRKALVAMQDRPWADYSGRAISARRIADMLRPFDIRPEHGANVNSYRIESFEDAWRRYKPPNLHGEQEAKQAGRSKEVAGRQALPRKKLKRYAKDARYLEKRRQWIRQKAVEDEVGIPDRYPQ